MAKKDTGANRSQAVSKAGVKRPEARFSARELSELKKKVENYIDSFMVKVGIKDPADQTDENGWRFFKVGSAIGKAGTIEVEDQVLFRVEAHLMSLPSDKDMILPLLRELLEINNYMLGECRFSISEEQIFAVVTYPAHVMEEDDIYRCIHNVMRTADNLDDALLKKYGGTSKKRG
jgi:hypothetical protein